MRCYIKIISLILIYILLSCSNEKKESGELNEEAVDEIEEHLEIEAEAEPIAELESGFTYNPKLNEYELYELIADLLKKEDFNNASAMIEAFNFSIKEFELSVNDELKAKADQAGFGHFSTLLYRFTEEKNHPNEKIIDFLLENGADPNTPSGSISELDYTYYPFYTTSCDKEVTDKLIEAGSKYALNAYLWCLVFYDEHKNDPSLANEISELISQGANPNLALSYAAHNGKTELFNQLLDNQASIDEALYWAVEYERMELVRKLVQNGAQLKSKVTYVSGGQVFFEDELAERYSNVAFSNNDELKEMLIPVTDGTVYSNNRRMEITCDPSVFIKTVKEQNIETVEFMLKTGADPNEYCMPEEPWNSDNCARGVALAAAKRNEHQEMIDLLLEFGAKCPEECENSS